MSRARPAVRRPARPPPPRWWREGPAALGTQAGGGVIRSASDQIACIGVTLLRRHHHPAIEAFEQAMVNASEIARGITHSESGWAFHPARAVAQTEHAALAPLADAIVMLSAPCPARVWAGDPPGDALVSRPTGDPACNTLSAMLHAPALTLPLMSVDGMPAGAQLVGQRDEDARVVSLARWVAREAGTVAV